MPLANEVNMKNGIWIEGPVKQGILDFVKGLLNSGKIGAVLMPAKNKREDADAWFLMDRDGLLASAAPISPVMTTQAGRMLHYLTAKGPLPEKTAVLLHPCEQRAIIELAKLKQVDLGNVVMITYDCPGVYPLETYLHANDQQALDDAFEACVERGGVLNSGRNACAICNRFTGAGADIEIGRFGADRQGFWLIAGSAQGEALLEGIPAKEADNLALRENAVLTMRLERETGRKGTLDAFQQTVTGTEGMLGALASCINCHNCSRVCPICFCRECYFDSRALASEADPMLQRAERKGGLRLPPDVLLFHLGRMTHMSLSCVSCGACEDACPAGVPVSMLFALAARDTQALFDYESGRRLDEPLPSTVFRFEELTAFEAPYRKAYDRDAGVVSEAQQCACR
jgi:formate dehydrogenase subunit beta